MSEHENKTAATHPDSAIPAKCSHCSKPMNTPLFCDYCETINPLPGVSDHFQLLGLPRTFELNAAALHESYVNLSRHTHPDHNQSAKPEVQSLAMTVSAAVNEAYRTLADPVRRAGYLLGLLGGPSSSQDKSVPDGFLGQMVMLREEMEEARQEHDQAKVARLQDVLRTQHDGLLRRLAGLYAQLEQASVCEATRQDLLHEIRKQLNAISYVKKMMSQ